MSFNPKADNAYKYIFGAFGVIITVLVILAYFGKI